MDGSFVRPRFTDGSFEDPLLLEEHFQERFLASRTPQKLIIEGRRGSGLTTALEILAEQARKAGRKPFLAGDFAITDPLPAFRALKEPGAILLADLSVTPAAKRDREVLRGLGPAFLRKRWLVVAGTELGGFLRWTKIDPSTRVELTAWGQDELLELLGMPEYRDHRGRLHKGFAQLAEGHRLLARPRTARWIVDAACRLGEGEPFTRSRLYANVLDELSPGSIDLARSAGDLEQALSDRFVAESLEAMEPLTWDGFLEDLGLDRILELFDAPPRAGRRLLRGLPPRGTSSPLALEGLHDFLRAGGVVKKIAGGEVPDRPDRPVIPFVVEMLTPPLEQRLVEWLGRRESQTAATLLHALGRKLELAPIPGRDLGRALLAGADLKRAQLDHACLTEADLSGARLDEADLRESRLLGIRAAAASFDRADLTGATMTGAKLTGASFRGAKLVKAILCLASLEGSCFTGALLGEAQLHESSLARADLTDASLRGASISKCDLAGADFTGADLFAIELENLDLRTVRFAPASLAKASIEKTRLSDLDLSGIVAPGAQFDCCELSGTRLAGAKLERAWFFVRAHEAIFDGADLRGAVFARCNFHAGSSRAGLLLGGAALEGNMTGYYKEGTTDDAWASPDSIRVASFQGADLDGARFVDTDLFRVDFRGAKLSRELRDFAQRSGAILD
jgi:uncharacterized protein YjbI with pentapeptide repeats